MRGAAVKRRVAPVGAGQEGGLLASLGDRKYYWAPQQNAEALVLPGDAEWT